MVGEIIMLSDLEIKFKEQGIIHTLKIDEDCQENIPYRLSEMFATVIRESSASPQAIIEELKSIFECYE